MFSTSVALSADGGTLAVGAQIEDSSATGVFHPGDPDYAAALASNADGAAYVYRRSSTGQWNVEAYVKAPNAGIVDQFGGSVALSANGGALAVGARKEDGFHIGAFNSGDRFYLAALADDSSSASPDSGAAYVYRRSGANRWSVEAYVKAPNAEGLDKFGTSVALSGDGATLAVGAEREDGSGHTAPEAWESADDSVKDAGAVYLY